VAFNDARMDKETARRQWSDRFNNRAPSARTPRTVEVKALESGVTEIMLYEEIGFWGVTAKEFVDQLSTLTAPAINVRINSPGGDVFDGLAIHNALKAYKGDVTCQIDGIAASAASFIALAGKKCVINQNALFMAHCAWGMGIGNKADMTEMADILAKIDDQIANIYARKSGKTPAECLAMMAGEGKNDGTWFTAQEAKDWGLVDGIMAPDEEDDTEAQNSWRMKIAAMRRRLSIAGHDD
jgi:ATP-dependent protease ClpP protease subunit